MGNIMTHALINPTVLAEDKEKIEAIFAMVEEHLGFVPDGLKLYSISPPLLEAFMGSVGYFLAHPELSQELLAMIRYLVSAEAGCRFCIDFNASILVNQGKSMKQLQATQADVSQAPLKEEEKVLLTIALAAINHPEGVTKEDLDVAYEQGYSARNVFDVVAIAANNKAFTYVLRTFKIEYQGSFA
jgi:alkylhydroperoxidase family enzyme